MTKSPFFARMAAAASTASLVIAASCASDLQAQDPELLPPAPADVPTLVLLITVDQLLPDYFERFGELKGGLGRLYRGGAVFTNAYHDHASTETAPGHASTLSGRFPASTGIVSNAAGVYDPQAPLIGGAAGPGASPFRFRGSTLTDWLRAKDPMSRALSVSRKDRGAILPIGRDPQHVYWYASNGTFTTSTWYRDTLPSWVQRFNARRMPHSYAGREWTLLLDESAYPESDSLERGSARGNVLFPHVVPSTPDSAAAFLPNFPFVDEVTLAFAIDGMQELQLGSSPRTDILAISLSATDAVGHAFGPDSREVHDHILRLDRMVGVFLDSLFRLRDSSKVVIALTSDHGVAPYPRVREQLGRGAAVYLESHDRLRAFTEALPAAGVPGGAVRIEDGVLLVDRPALARAGVNADSLVASFISVARAIPGVARVDRLSELARADTSKDFIARRWLNTLPPDMPAEAVLTPIEYAVPLGSTYAQHGSPYDYDAHVPVIFYGRPFRAGRYDAFARVVDMAPTLAWVTATTPQEKLDGRVLRAAVR